MRAWRSKVWILLPLLLIVVSGVIAWRLLAVPPPKVQAVSCTESNASNFACWQSRYKTIVSQDSAEAAFVDFKQNYKTNPYVKSNCHQIGHVIGRLSAQKYNSLKETYAHGDNFCSSGYYHGAIETIAQQLGPEKILGQINNVCADFNKNEQYSLNHHNCVHGLGHGLMAVQEGNLFEALKSCDLYDSTWQQESCYGGVFMENIMNTINPGKHSDYLKADEPLYPCTFVPDRQKNPCYLMQTSYALNVMDSDFARVFALCSTVAEPYDATCYQSLGRDVSGRSSSDKDTTLANCALGTTERAQENCYTGVVKDFIWYYNDVGPGLALCAGISNSRLSASCNSQAKSYYATF